MNFKNRNKKTMIILLIGSIVVILLLLGLITWTQKHRFEANKKSLNDAANKTYEDALTAKSNGVDMTFEERTASYKQSIVDLNKVVANDPANTNALMKLASAYYNTGDKDSAIATIEKAIKYDPTNNILFNNLGNFYQEIKDYETAIKNYKKSIDLNSKYPNAYTNLAVVQHDFMNLKDEAIQTLSDGFRTIAR
jgi:tetratricopeptide (TPR) repeat protein